VIGKSATFASNKNRDASNGVMKAVTANRLGGVKANRAGQMYARTLIYSNLTHPNNDKQTGYLRKSEPKIYLRVIPRANWH
jgi:hypothetical protein